LQASPLKTHKRHPEGSLHAGRAVCDHMRENTEWVETVEDGWNVLVGADYGGIVDAIAGFEGAGERNDVFGRGYVSEEILEII